MGKKTVADKFQVDFEPVGRRVACTPGSTLLAAAQQAGVMLAAVCGGEGACGRCVVRVLSGQVSAPTLTEQTEIAPDDLARGVRLACQTSVESNVRVHVPPESLITAQRTQVESEAFNAALEPAAVAQDVKLAAPTLRDLRADTTRLVEALGMPASPVSFDTLVLRQLSGALRAWEWRARVVLRALGVGREVVAVRPSAWLKDRPRHDLLGLAVDIGTTKLAAFLLDLESGQTLGAAGAMNPQIAYGEDVMSRIAYVMQGETRKTRDEEQNRAITLQESVVDSINDMAASLCAQAGAEAADIADAVIVGNTAMHHLFAGLPVSQLGLAPYVAAVSDPLDIKAREVGLALAPGAYIHLLPNIAGFVGADHVAMLLASGLGDFSCGDAEQNQLGLDIGTNTEICLRAGGKLWSCSTASGPAFEGAHIQHGMRAAPGAIERVAIHGDEVHFKTVNDAPPVGLCGSGILDLIAQLRRAGILDARGAFRAHPRVRGDRFILVAGESNDGREITLSRADISEVQLAKAAIRAGLAILLKEARLTEADVQGVVIAGAFGTYLDVQSGIDIGLFPRVERSRFRQIGNAAGAGARMALLSMRERERAAEIARRVEYVELTAVPEFQREFAGAMRLNG